VLLLEEAFVHIFGTNEDDQSLEHDAGLKASMY